MTQGLERTLNRMWGCGTSIKSVINAEDASSNFYTKFFTIDTSDLSRVVCPLLYINSIYNAITDSIENSNVPDKIIIPIELNATYIKEVKTIDSALKYIFDSGGTIIESVKNKNEIFYGNKHLLLDSNFRILFMSCITIDFSSTNYQVKDFTIKIRPSLLVNQHTNVEKAIMKKLLPYYITTAYNHPYLSYKGMTYTGAPSVSFEPLSNITITSTIQINYPYSILDRELPNLVASMKYDH